VCSMLHGTNVQWSVAAPDRRIPAEENAAIGRRPPVQQQSAVSQGHGNYDRACSACMAGRGYTVRRDAPAKETT